MITDPGRTVVMLVEKTAMALVSHESAVTASVSPKNFAMLASAATTTATITTTTRSGSTTTLLPQLVNMIDLDSANLSFGILPSLLPARMHLMTMRGDDGFMQPNMQFNSNVIADDGEELHLDTTEEPAKHDLTTCLGRGDGVH